MQKYLDFLTDTTIDLKLKTMKVEKMCTGRELNEFTCNPCGGLQCSSWRPSCTVQNLMGLMHLINCVCIFDEVLLGVHCFSLCPNWSLVT